jgi:DNA-binding response OmpR family regulator
MTCASILIIEDDPALQRGLIDNFKKRGYLVQVAADGQAGLAAALNQSFDVVLLDIMLPRMNGFEVCSKLRAKNVASTIIMLTAKGHEDDIVRGLEMGADDYVTKPFSIRELVARVEAFLRRRLASVDDVTTFGPYRLDRVAHKLFCDDQEIELTSKEYRLLEYFVAQTGRALTRTDILNAVWGTAVIVTSRSVDRCVTTLRAKIEADPHQPQFIRTIRDVGYRFER